METEVIGLVLHPDEPLVWVDEGRDGHCLPDFVYEHDQPEYLASQSERAWVRRMEAVLGCGMYALGNLNEGEVSPRCRWQVVCLFRLRQGEPRPGGWCSRELLRSTTLESDPYDHPVVRIQEDIRVAYLNAWTDWMAFDSLGELWPTVEMLACLSMALHLPFP
ncbi:TPA: hypothetical protein DCE37_02270 [Candidatus Latescibacteria bacterium]|nr:hypothetical protein [Candidatus Latescibacterota bacterium]